MDTKSLHTKNVLGKGIIDFFASHLKTAVLIVDMEGKVVFLNCAAEALLRTSQDTALNKPGDALFPDYYIHINGFRGIIEDIYHDHLTSDSREPDSGRSMLLLSSPEAGKRAQLTLAFTPYSAGDDFLVMIAITSSSFIKGPPKELELSEGLYRLVVDTAATAIFTVDLDMLITDINDEFTNVTGYTRDDILGKPCSILKADPCLHQCGLYALGDNERIFKRECRMLGKDGSLITVKKNATIVKDPDGVICGGVESFIDISDMRNALEKAEEVSAAKSSFLAMMSHEIRTPMNGVIGLAEMLSTSRLNSDDSEMVQTIRDSATSLLGLLNETLDFSKGEAGKFERHDVCFDLRRELKLLLSPIIPSMDKKGLELQFSVDDAIPQIIEGDMGHLKQILLNLLTNAVKFTSMGNIRLLVTTIRVAGLVHFLQFEVEDTGIGISQEEIHSIFLPFTQACTSQSYEGTGLGLAICSRLVKLLGGKLLVESELKSGSRFIVQLPFRECSPMSKSSIIASSNLGPLPLEKVVDETDILSQQSDSIPRTESLPILIADDDSVNRRVASRMLSRLGYKYHCVESGIEVLNVLKTESFSMILLDRRMPDMDGLETARAIRKGVAGEAVRNIPIVALTGSVYSEDEAACYEAGMNAFISKPIDLDNLKEIVSRILKEQQNKNSD